MRCVSIWNPYASLIVHGFKLNETRSYAAPASILGTRIGIASTKTIKSEQRALFADERFQHYYGHTGLPGLDDLPHGYLLGTVLVHSYAVITKDDLDDVNEEEQCYGWWKPGRYAWRLYEPEFFARPIPVVGRQGIWNFQRS
jgi:hypothetical protein